MLSDGVYIAIKSLTMAPSKSTRIIILLAIDSAFFLLELVVGELGSQRSLALQLQAKLTRSQALPYIHWPSLQTPFIWSVLLRPFSRRHHIRNLVLITRYFSSTMSSRFASDCGRSKWHIKKQIRRRTRMGYGITTSLLTQTERVLIDL